jgi:hypothetical protein
VGMEKPHGAFRQAFVSLVLPACSPRPNGIVRSGGRQFASRAPRPAVAGIEDEDSLPPPPHSQGFNKSFLKSLTTETPYEGHHNCFGETLEHGINWFERMGMSRVFSFLLVL